MNKGNYRLPILVAITGILIIIILSVVYVLTDGGSAKKDKAKVSGTPTPSSGVTQTEDPALTAPDETLHSMNAIIKGIDLDNAIVTVRERGTEAEYEFTYNGATDIRTAYDRQITATMLKPGDFVNLSYNDGYLLRSMTGSKDVKIYKNILQRTQDDSLRKITVGGTIYRYGDDLLVLNEGYFVGIDTLREMDVISIYSVDDYIYLINVERGHGYFRMVNHSYFVGGTLKVGKNYSCEITEDLNLTLEEGEYSIVVEHEDFIGEAVILIERDYTTRLDMSAYTPESALMGFCMFDISPASALLYVDGILTPYDTAVELSHGEHWIQVAAGGYTPYTGFIEIGDSIKSLNIMLSPAPSKTPDIMYEDTGEGSDNTDVSYSAESGEDTSNGTGGIADSTSDKGDTLIEPDDPSGEGSDNGSEGGNSSDNGDNTGNGESGVDNGDNTGNNGTDDNGGSTGNSDNNTGDNTGDNNNETGDNTGDSENGTVSNTGNASITIFATEGAAVFVDDVFKGTIINGAVKLPKTAGTHTVRLTKEGYLTRRYTIYVEDDQEDAEFTFPEMVAE